MQQNLVETAPSNGWENQEVKVSKNGGITGMCKCMFEVKADEKRPPIRSSMAWVGNVCRGLDTMQESMASHGQTSEAA